MKKRGSKTRMSKKRSLSHLTLIISGFALLLFFIFNLSLEGILKETPFDQEIVLFLISILTISFVVERGIKIKKGSIYEIFFSSYLALSLILLTIIYWISILNSVEINVFRTLIVFTHIIVFLYSLITIQHSKKLWFIVVSYAFTAIITIILFAFIYWTLSIFGLGHLQFSQCSALDPGLKSENWFYFSSVTFYALGYGDICPMLAPMRFFSQLEVAIGALINTILIGFIFWRIKEIESKKKT